ncbi:hypothetical protein F5882DRAFT_376768 [Hyaloscypha sp. PMI_1271]|nr:hypothetical protein F5882DRAFT_376768 [Hyaloscypha sp. PMI_1271]
MASRKTRAQSKAAVTATAPEESPTTESLSENQQTPSYHTEGLPSEGVSSEISVASDLCKSQPAPEGLSEDSQAAENPANYLTAGEVPKGLPAVAGPSEDLPNAEGSSGDLKLVEDFTVTPPAEEVPLKSPPTNEPSTPLPQLGSPSKDQSTPKAQVGDRHAAKGPTTMEHKEKAPKDLPAMESLSNGECTAEVPTTDSSHGKLQSDDHTTESLPITKPAAESLPSSRELPDVPMAKSELQKDLPSNPPSSDITQDTLHEAEERKLRLEKSRKRTRDESRGNVNIIDLTSSDSGDETASSERSDEPMPKRPKHEREERSRSPALSDTPPNSPENSTRYSNDESKKRKGHPRRFTDQHLNKYIDHESKWFKAMSKGCSELSELQQQQAQEIGSLEALRPRYDEIISKLSVESLSKNKRIKLTKLLRQLEKKRNRRFDEIRQTGIVANRQGITMRGQLASWYAQDRKVTERIEKCQ